MSASYIWILLARQRFASQPPRVPRTVGGCGRPGARSARTFFEGARWKQRRLGVQQGMQFGILLENLDLMINLRGTVMMGHLLMLGYAPYGAANEKREFGAAVIFDAPVSFRPLKKIAR